MDETLLEYLRRTQASSYCGGSHSGGCGYYKYHDGMSGSNYKSRC